MVSNNKYRTWIEISKSAIKNNYQTFRKLLKPGVKMLGVVKSNAYGHELFGFAKTLADFGIDWLGVDSITEANALREKGVGLPILVLGYTLPANFSLAHHQNIALTISNFENLRVLSRQKHRIAIHLKIDTGMHRQGFFLNDLPQALEIIKKHRHIRLQGLYTHFAAAKRPDATNATDVQIRLFNEARRIVEQAGFDVITHAAATAGTLNYPEAHFDMVRIGIGLYGYWPSHETKIHFQDKINLNPVLTWKTIVSEIKTVEKGERIGYDYTERLRRTSRLAVLPIGYWHGYWRAWSGRTQVLIGGCACKVIGRVAMDMIVVDVTELNNIKVGDEVILLGSQNNTSITADDLAGFAKTTCYEVVTRLNPLIKKYFV